MNLNEVIEFLKGEPERTWHIAGDGENQLVGGYILPNFSLEKYPEYEQDYAALASSLQWHEYTNKNGIERIGCCPDAMEFEDEDNNVSNGAYEVWEDEDVTMTSSEAIDYLLQLEEKLNAIYLFNKKVCEKCGRDYDAYNHFEFISNGIVIDIELMKDESGYYNGKLLLSCKNEDGVLEKYLGKDKEVTIPEKTTKISAQAFLDTDVERITIPNGVKCYVNAYAFEHCESLKYVYFGSDVEITKGHYEGGELFDGPDTIFYCCDALECIEVSPDNPYISSENGKLYNKDKTKLLYDPADKSWWEDDEE